MLKFSVSLVILILVAQFISAQKISGIIKDSAGAILPYSTIELKEKRISTTANVEGRFNFTVTPGTYTLICQHVGYERQEKKVTLGVENIVVEFLMKAHSSTLTEVIVQKGEDPAYEIIRNAIRKRPDHKKEVDKFSVEVYTKGQLRLRDFPKKFMGKEVDFEDGDSSKRKILFLSETISQYSVEKPNSKVEVYASRVSGQDDGFGLSAPNLISFYENNIRVGNLNPRGFISPIADNALNFYRFKYEGAFREDGREISRIRVIPKRKFEPVFSGIINIIENEWRIHSLQLELTKDYGIQLVDTIRMEQLFVPAGNIWVVKSQVMYPAIKMFGFDAHGSFANVYSSYQLSPNFPDGFFTKTVIKYTDSSNKRTENYWEGNRPVVLQQDEVEDYRKKDSLADLRKSPAYRDSMDKTGNKLSLGEVMLTGFGFSNSKKHRSISVASLIETISYNTVAGAVVNLRVSLHKRLDTSSTGVRSYRITPELRYGFSNQHFNPRVSFQYNFGGKRLSSLSLAGGSDVFQFNNDNPVKPLHNTIATLFYGKNFLKIYEAGFAAAQYTRGFDGFTLSIQSGFQNRSPLENTTDFQISGKEGNFTPNRPLPFADYNISQHQAFSSTFTVWWQPGSKFIEFPGRKLSLGSKYPAFSVALTHGFKSVLSSDVDYTKWLGRVNDHLNFKMLGTFNYRVDVGGFLRDDAVPLPDLIHFKGNSSDVAGSFGDRFQMVPHYYLSTGTSLYGLAFTEHHFNGFITNKIPGIKQLKWNLVAGARAVSIRSGKDYIEPFVGLENIFKVLRVDYVWGFERNGPNRGGIRFGMSGGMFGQ